jgi:hypothetical protein
MHLSCGFSIEDNKWLPFKMYKTKFSKKACCVRLLLLLLVAKKLDAIIEGRIFFVILFFFIEFHHLELSTPTTTPTSCILSHV